VTDGGDGVVKGRGGLVSSSTLLPLRSYIGRV